MKPIHSPVGMRCDLRCTMGKGIAAQIKAAFPGAYRADLNTKDFPVEVKLGTISEWQNQDLVVVNAYAQADYRGRGVKTDYGALRQCLRLVKERHPGKRIGMPKIGAGLAGGDWSRIKQIIEDELGGENVTIVLFGN